MPLSGVKGVSWAADYQETRAFFRSNQKDCVQTNAWEAYSIGKKNIVYLLNIASNTVLYPEEL